MLFKRGGGKGKIRTVRFEEFGLGGKIRTVRFEEFGLGGKGGERELSNYCGFTVARHEA